MAAHFLARVQTDAQERLRWNQVALDAARRAAGDGIAGFFPSLYLNLGRSHEDLGDHDRALVAYLAADARLDTLEDDPYGDLVRRGIAAALERMRTGVTQPGGAASGRPAGSSQSTQSEPVSATNALTAVPMVG